MKFSFPDSEKVSVFFKCTRVRYDNEPHPRPRSSHYEQQRVFCQNRAAGRGEGRGSARAFGDVHGPFVLQVVQVNQKLSKKGAKRRN